MFQYLWKKIRHYYRFCYKKVLFFKRKNQHRFFFFEFEDLKPKFFVSERYKKTIIVILRIITFIGLFGSIFAFKEWYFNLLLAVLILLLERFLEKTIYVHHSLYITPISNYNYTFWLGMIWVYPLDDSLKYFEIGMHFSSKETAEEVFSVIKAWNKNISNDSLNMVQISIITNNEKDDYHVFIYSNVNNSPDFISTKELAEAENPDKKHIMHVAQIIYCKAFKYSTSLFIKFEKKYSTGDEYNFYAYVMENGNPKRLDNLGYIKKSNLKIKEQKDLTIKDREYEHFKLLIDRHKYEKEGPPPKSREFITNR